MAAADWPSVDPNDVNGVGIGDLGARLFSTPFEPGSVIKVATFASLLDQGTKTRSAAQIADAIDYVGGALGAGGECDEQQRRR